MRTSWEKVTEYVGTTYGQDISNELQNKVTVILPEPAHDADVLARHSAREAVVRAGQANIQTARRAGIAILEAAVMAGKDPDAPMRLALLQNEIANGALEASEDVPMHLTDSEKTQHSNEWRTFRERNAHLAKH